MLPADSRTVTTPSPAGASAARGSSGAQGALSRPSGRTSLRRTLLVLVAALVVVDVVGGLLAIATGVNDASQAWGGEALLAAPVPMIVLQLVLTGLAVGRRRRVAIIAAWLLAIACLLSVMSGFFDGGLASPLLTPGLHVYQGGLLALTAAVGVVAALHALRRHALHRRRNP